MLMIGEKLNGSIPSVKDAIARRDANRLRELARMQAEAGAAYIDVCASVEVDAEVETLRFMIDCVQAVTDTPICLDSPNPHSLVAAMPFCRRAGILNSVSLEGDKLDTILPAIQDTDWQCVALLCTERGIPQNAAERLDALTRIMERMQACRIAPERLHIDPLVITLSTDPNTLAVFAECAREIRRRYPGVHITSGLSNISFGLPERRYINQAFLVLAMDAGMDSVIVDPTNRDMRAMMHAADALLGNDASGIRYIRFIGENPRTPSAPAAPAATAAPAAPAAPQIAAGASVGQLAEIRNTVIDGKHNDIAGLVTAALDAGTPPADILNDGMIAAMTDIGERFSKGEAYVPELMLAARTMKAGVVVLKPHLAAGSAGARGKVVIGTVAGDLHDIGKNLVGMMIESAGFELIDLGADVSAERFIAAVRENENVRLVALSSLLTTTMPSMQNIVQALRTLDGFDFKIIVGGAPVTEAFAQAIGADGYSADAAGAAALARALTA